MIELIISGILLLIVFCGYCSANPVLKRRGYQPSKNSPKGTLGKIYPPIPENNDIIFEYKGHLMNNNKKQNKY